MVLGRSCGLWQRNAVMSNPLSSREGARGVSTLTFLLSLQAPAIASHWLTPTGSQTQGPWPPQSLEVSPQWVAKGREYIWRVK